MYKYEIKRPTIDELQSFLYITKDDFCPSLDLRVNIEEYTYKLYSNAMFVICRHVTAIVGIICCYQNRPPIGYISHVGVLKSHRQKGIMRNLFLMLFENAGKNSIKELRLEVNNQNNIAINAYKTMGFIDYKNEDNSLYMRCKL